MLTNSNIEICLVGGCDRTIVYKKHGLCRAHALRYYRHGDPGATPIKKAKIYPPYRPREAK